MWRVLRRNEGAREMDEAGRSIVRVHSMHRLRVLKREKDPSVEQQETETQALVQMIPWFVSLFPCVLCLFLSCFLCYLYCFQCFLEQKQRNFLFCLSVIRFVKAAEQRPNGKWLHKWSSEEACSALCQMVSLFRSVPLLSLQSKKKKKMMMMKLAQQKEQTR